MKPYYDSDGITIYHGDCREVLPSLGPVDLVLTDPPYGRGTDDRFGSRDRLTNATPYTPIFGDDEPFDPSHLFKFSRLILWGGNWFANKLPPSNGWIVWDKKAGLASNDFGDVELAWSNVVGSCRLFTHRWSGMLKDSERDERRIHPTQKPVALMTWCLSHFSKPGDLILDPYMGSGPVGRACYDMGRQYIGIEIEERYCEQAVKRLAQGVLELA